VIGAVRVPGAHPSWPSRAGLARVVWVEERTGLSHILDEHQRLYGSTHDPHRASPRTPIILAGAGPMLGDSGGSGTTDAPEHPNRTGAMPLRGDGMSVARFMREFQALDFRTPHIFRAPTRPQSHNLSRRFAFRKIVNCVATMSRKRVPSGAPGRIRVERRGHGGADRRAHRGRIGGRIGGAAATNQPRPRGVAPDRLTRQVDKEGDVNISGGKHQKECDAAQKRFTVIMRHRSQVPA
jgi:hypothetical protein